MYCSILYAKKGVWRLWQVLQIELLFSLKGSRIYISQIGDHSSFEIQVSKINLSLLQCEIEALTLLIEEVSNTFPRLDGVGFLLPNLRDLHRSLKTSNVGWRWVPKALSFHIVSIGVFLPWRDLLEDMETSPQNLYPRKEKKSTLFFNFQSIRVLIKFFFFLFITTPMFFKKIPSIKPNKFVLGWSGLFF